MIKTCANKSCNKEFKAKRDTAKYCSEKCKKAFQRVSGTNSEIKSLSGTKEGKMTDKVSGTEKQVSELIDKSQLATQAGALKVPASFDDLYSPNYDLTEAGFLRRSKNWMDFSERFRNNIKAVAVRIKKGIAVELKEARKKHKDDWISPLLNTKLMPKA